MGGVGEWRGRGRDRVWARDVKWRAPVIAAEAKVHCNPSRSTSSNNGALTTTTGSSRRRRRSGSNQLPAMEPPDLPRLSSHHLPPPSLLPLSPRRQRPPAAMIWPPLQLLGVGRAAAATRPIQEIVGSTLLRALSPANRRQRHGCRIPPTPRMALSAYCKRREASRCASRAAARGVPVASDRRTRRLPHRPLVSLSFESRGASGPRPGQCECLCAMVGRPGAASRRTRPPLARVLDWGALEASSLL
jgi:hypothetical protein